MRWALALLLALATGVGALYWVTAGFTALTAEDARREAVALEPRPLPDARVLAADGRTLSLLDVLSADGRVAIINFFYSRCVSLCLAQGAQTERLQRAIDEQGLAGRVRLISLSFDSRDRAPELADYARRMHARPEIWQFLSFADPAARDRLLSLFGIVVVPAPLGQFEHNAAFHVVTPGGRLARIVDLDDPGEALQAAEALAAGAAR
ncbi:SCO family protein [Castellaniella sp. GW247-6E4]|uniref:SCO family protein n=1 Tax=Castellaniella sp. GW247-6E4 TaxID=3140380 RepID=UPI003315BC1E